MSVVYTQVMTACSCANHDECKRQFRCTWLGVPLAGNDMEGARVLQERIRELEALMAMLQQKAAQERQDAIVERDSAVYAWKRRSEAWESATQLLANTLDVEGEELYRAACNVIGRLPDPS